MVHSVFVCPTWTKINCTPNNGENTSRFSHQLSKFTYQMTCPSAEPEKNSVPLFELIQETEFTASRWQTSRSLIATGSLSVRVSQAATCPLYMPLIKLVGSFWLYSKQINGLHGFRFIKGLFGFSGQMKRTVHEVTLNHNHRKHSKTKRKAHQFPKYTNHTTNRYCFAETLCRNMIWPI